VEQVKEEPTMISNEGVVELPTVPKVEEPSDISQSEEKFDDSFIVMNNEEKPATVQTTPDGGISEIAEVNIASNGMLDAPVATDNTDVGEPLLEIVDEDDSETGNDFE